MITLLLVLCFFILANIWYAVTGTCWTIKRTLAERIECFGFSEALIEMTKCDSDWESLGEYVDRLCRKRDFLDDIIKDIAWRV